MHQGSRLQELHSALLVAYEFNDMSPGDMTYYRGADKSLALPTSRCGLFDGENISFDASLVIYIYIYIYIQGVTGGTDQTSGECSLGPTIPI
jgi:hypothetical protein